MPRNTYYIYYNPLFPAAFAVQFRVLVRVFPKGQIDGQGGGGGILLHSKVPGDTSNNHVWFSLSEQCGQGLTLAGWDRTKG